MRRGNALNLHEAIAITYALMGQTLSDAALEVACQVDQPTDEYAASEVLRRLTEPRPAAAR